MNTKDYEKVEIPLIPFRVKLKYPECGEGYLEFDGETTLSYLPNYSHSCTNCDYSEYIKYKIYPEIIYKQYNELDKDDVEKILFYYNF